MTTAITPSRGLSRRGRYNGPRRGSFYRKGHSLSMATEKMLFELLAAAITAYRREAVDGTISAESLRKQWTKDALRQRPEEEARSWKTLSNDDVDLLKPYLIWKAEERNEVKAAAYATAVEDGYRRRLVHSIWENANAIAALSPNHLSPDQREYGAEMYIRRYCEASRYSTTWRTLLIPLLEQVAMTIEERKRSAEARITSGKREAERTA